MERTTDGTLLVPREQREEVDTLAQGLREGAFRGGIGGALSFVPQEFRRRGVPHTTLRVPGRGGTHVFSQPDLGDVHVDGPLTMMSVAYRNTMYIGDMLFPRVPVVKESDLFFEFERSPWLRDEARERAIGGDTPLGGFGVTTGSYSVTEYIHGFPIDDRQRRNADSPIDLDQLGVEFTADKLDLKLEKQVATLANTSANWTTNVTLAGAQQWNDAASTPFSDLRTARVTVLRQIGRPANTLVLGYEVFETLALHAGLIDRVKYTGTQDRPAMVTARMMAALFQVDQVLIGAALEDSSVEGAAASVAYLWGKHAFLCYVPSRASINTPSAGYVFTTGRGADRYRDDSKKSDIIRSWEAFQAKRVAAGAGYRIVNAIA